MAQRKGLGKRRRRRQRPRSRRSSTIVCPATWGGHKVRKMQTKAGPRCYVTLASGRKRFVGSKKQGSRRGRVKRRSRR